MKTQKLNEVEGIRGIAVIFVVLSHLSNPGRLLFSGGGKTGVWLFFVLSAFLLTRYFIARPERIEKPIEWLNYFFRRILRIYPLYIVALLAYFFSGAMITSPAVIMRHLLLQKGYGHFWTMPVEITFYLLLPVVIIFLRYVARSSLLPSIFFLFGAIALNEAFYPAVKSPSHTIDLIWYLPVFLTGSVAAVIHENLSKKQIPRKIRWGFDLGALLILAGTVLTMPGIFSKLFYPVSLEFSIRMYNYYGIAWGLFIIFVFNGSGLTRRLANLKLFKFSGRISYDIYLIHYLFITLALKYYHKIDLFSGTTILGATLLSSVLMHYLIERPLINVSLLRFGKAAQQEPLPQQHAV